MVEQTAAVVFTHTRLWAWYLAGAMTALLCKFLMYYSAGKKLDKTLKMVSREWFFERSLENAVSWIATILLVWCAGVSYIDSITFLWADFLKSIPAHPAFAALFGFIMEYTAPNVFKWVLSKTPWGAA